MHNSCVPIYDDLLNRYLYSDIDDVDANSHLYTNSDFSTNSIISKPLQGLSPLSPLLIHLLLLMGC